MIRILGTAVIAVALPVLWRYGAAEGTARRGYAAAGRYDLHAAGIVGLDTRMKISACGVRGARCGCMFA